MKLYQKLSWKFLKATFGIYCKLYYKIECIKHHKEPKPPYILLANHAHELDAFLIAYFLKHPVHYLGSDEKSSLLQLILAELVGMFYTQKGTIDTKAAKKIFSYLKNNESVAFFPEGEGTYDGETDDFSFNIIKLIKKFNIPILTVNITGGYLTKPKWSKHSRHGKVIIQFRTITKEEINKLNNDEIYNKVKKHIYNNDIKSPILQNVKFIGKNLTHDVQYVLWKCPKCYSIDTIYGKKNTIFCTKCNSQWNLDGNMRITPFIKNLIDLKDWNEWQKEEIKKTLKSKKINELTKSKNVDLYIFKKYSKGLNKRKIIYKKISTGEIILTNENLIFQSYASKENQYFEIKKLKYFVECINQYLRFHYENNIYKIEFNNKNISRYIYFLRLLYK
jgi:1-acyl-sn-glycerol-3-phosphate acyltransferase